MLTKVLTAAIFLASTILTCSVSPDFQFATLEEQIDYAGIILTGNVTNVDGDINSDNILTLNNVKYYRGCGSANNIKVKGFKGGHLCGSGIPKKGDNIIVFACYQEKDFFVINNFILFTGFVTQNLENENKVQEITGRKSTENCRCARKYERCLKREDNECFVKISKKPIFEPVFIPEEKIIAEPLPNAPLPKNNNFFDLNKFRNYNNFGNIKNFPDFPQNLNFITKNLGSLNS